MPKVPTGSARPALRRNQACLSCRKRKLKCDAARPHCGTCVKQWQALISVPPPVGYAHPTEPQCSYDPVEGLPIAPDVDPAEKIRLLEEQISMLKSQLNESRSYNSRSASPPRHFIPSHNRLNSVPSTSGSHSSARVRSPNSSPNGNGIVLPQAPLDIVNAVSMNSPDSQFRGSTGSPELRQPNNHSDAFLDILYPGWDPDLPTPDVLEHYIDVFFRCDPCGSRVLHKPSFLSSMHLHPKDPNFPHSAILHAICASASRWASHDIATSPDGTRRDRVAEFHVSKTRAFIDKTMASGQDIFQVMQACIILSWYFYQEGRWVEVWIFAGFQSRVAVPLRLNYPGTFASQGGNSPGAYLAPPRNPRELETRRRTWWMTIMFDRIVSVGGWLHGVDERDIGTELPLRCVDFESDSNITSNVQDLSTKNLFIHHPLAYTDSFLLFLKSVMLFGRVTDYNTRSTLRGQPNKNHDPFYSVAFQELDQLVHQGFLKSLPPAFAHLDVSDGGALDTDLYMVHVVPHAAAITLHNPFINFDDPKNVSSERCIYATRSILAAYYSLSGTSLDISRLHPFVTICWYLAAVVQIQLCKYFIEIGDTARESTVWGDINLLRFAMLTYGSRSPIGTRQEKLLQGLMTEIVRMTTQDQPLEVGIPLYPFSHQGVFPKSGQAGHTAGTSAPLPDSNQFEDQRLSTSSPGSIHGISLTPPATATASSSMAAPPTTVPSHTGMSGWTGGVSPRPHLVGNIHPPLTTYPH